MKVLLAAIAWMLCTILVISPTLATPSTPPKEKLQFTKLTWQLDYEPETYSTFINSTRRSFDSFGKVCNIPVTPKSPKTTETFILVDIINTSAKTITAVFQTTNLYFVGYIDKITKNGKTSTRANIVSNFFDKLKDNDVFKAADIKKKLPFKESYTDLERVAGSRKNLPLGIVTLSSYIDTIYGKDYTSPKVSNGNYNMPKAEEIGKSLAKFALMAIQMIAEATRFIYIEDMVKEKGIYGSFLPDSTFILLQTNWGSFSQLIHKSSPGCKPVKSPNFPWDDIKEQVGLLNTYVGNALDDVVPFMEGIFGNDDAHDVVLEFIM